MKKRRLNILITAGPTREPIDPVRFISNYSTGTLGYEIAKEAKRRGHSVTLISGPVALNPPRGIKLIGVQTGLQMRQSLRKFFDWADCLIMAAAVSDYRPSRTTPHKISKARNTVLLKLTKNPDILSELSLKKRDKVFVGFCLETRDILKRAVKKLTQKRLDLIVANSISRTNNPFGDKKSNFLIIDKKKSIRRLYGIPKSTLSKLLLDRVEVMV